MVSFNLYNSPEDYYPSHSNKEKIEVKGGLSNLPDGINKIAKLWSKPKYIQIYYLNYIL